FDTSTVNADPGSGKFRLSNATQNASIALYINTTSYDAVSLTTVLLNLTNSSNSNKALLCIREKTDVTRFLLFYITATTVHSGYTQFAVTPLAWSSANPFSASDECLLCVDQIGDLGATGATGAYGGPLTFDYLFDNGTSNADPGSGRF